MRRFCVLFLPIAVLIAGCQHLSLRNHTERQARTLTGLHYSQVLDNIALFTQNPNALPFFSVAGQGQTSNNYSVNPGGGFNWDLINFNNGPPLFFFDHASLTWGGTFTANEGWNTANLVNPDALLLMRCVYQRVVGYPACDCDCEKKLQAYFAGHPCYLEAMRPGWYGVGRRCDVPRCAAFVGHYGHRYAWVTAEGVDALSRLSLAILDLATIAAPFVMPDPQATLIRQLTDSARDLTAILSQYPQPHGKAYNDLKDILDATTAALVLAHQNKPPEEIDNVKGLSEAAKEHAKNLLTAPASRPGLAPPIAAPSPLEFRPRVNLYNPFQGALSPPFLPGR
jgi:hypothetical protein